VSGGSLNYLYSRVEEAAGDIAIRYGNQANYNSTGIAFAKLLLQVSKALKDVEWDMSGDGSDWSEVKKLIGPKEEATAVRDDLMHMIERANEMLDMLDARTKSK
jgi:hypothetical protein